MTLSEFKGWFEERTNNIFKEYRYVTMSDIVFIKEKLASVEDEYKLQCQLCKSTEPCRCYMPQLAPQCPHCELVYVPIYGVETKCGNCMNKEFDRVDSEEFAAQSQKEKERMCCACSKLFPEEKLWHDYKAGKDEYWCKDCLNVLQGRCSLSETQETLMGQKIYRVHPGDSVPRPEPMPEFPHDNDLSTK